MMKVPTTDWDSSGPHNVECTVYEQLHGLDLLPSPSIWYIRRTTADHSGILLMNDLSVDAISPGYLSALTLQQVLHFLETKASF